MMHRLCAALAAASLALAAAGASAQQELVIGLSTPITSLDPHFHNLSPNNSMARHVFETLVANDEAQHMKPGLAESWKPVEPTVWEFKLRKGVRWHDGSELVADDVIATLKRVPNVPNSPASMAIYTRSIIEATALDKYTLRFRTATPYPLLPNDLTAVPI